MKLIIQPEAGLPPVLRAIRMARKSIDIVVFRLDREEIEKALGSAVQRGVTVRALIAHTNRGGEAGLRKLEQRLLAAGVSVSRSSDDFARYHAKYMIADSTLYLFGFNLTKLDIDKSRSFAIATAFVGSQSLRKDELENRREVGLIVTSPAVPRKLLQVFESDWSDAGKGSKTKDAA